MYTYKFIAYIPFTMLFIKVCVYIYVILHYARFIILSKGKLKNYLLATTHQLGLIMAADFSHCIRVPGIAEPLLINLKYIIVFRNRYREMECMSKEYN